MSEIVKDKHRMVITSDLGNGDEAQFTKHRDGSLTIEVCEPWAGSTETGFGATTSITLTAENVVHMIEWLK